jgi:type II secretory pathway component GspD/PulD (secretin)
VPETTSQQTNTTVIVRDGETIVIGGLISELESDERSQIPILGSIPLLGHLFKKTGTAKTRAELLVFVTPKIMPY